MISSRPWLFGGARLIFAAAIVATAGNAAAGGRAEDAAEPNPSVTGFDVSAGSKVSAGSRASGGSSVAADPNGSAHPSVTVDLSVIEQQGAGSTPGSLTRPHGLLMPIPGVMPQSQLHEPSPRDLPYATLTPPRQRAVNLRPPGSNRSTPRIRALALTDPTPPPRPPEKTPPSEVANTSIGQEPRAVTAPSKVGGVVAPASSLPQTLDPEDAGPARLASEPPDGEEAIAATDPVAITPPFSGTSAPPSVPAATETASTPRETTPDPATVQEAAATPAPAKPASTPDTEQAAKMPALEVEEKTVALQPASRGEGAVPPPAKEVLATGELVEVAFEQSETDLSGSSRAELKELAARLRSQEGLRLQLLAYAEGTGMSPSKARRISLSRALAVRSYLIENGIKTSRIDLRALGNKAPSAPLDRVDVKVIQR